ncbi:hypothetical protein [Nostoc sp.]|uniref:hypothetical protein n=1 Tax=Nostoc sp. TaxID=1180 RepID=UPI002FF276BD
MLSPDLKNALPTTDELPCSDDTPVDNEDQNFLPNILRSLLLARGKYYELLMICHY